MSIHPTAVVDAAAEIDPTAEIGAYAIVEGHTRIGPQVRVYPHAYVASYARIAARCEIHPFAVVGHVPQDVKFGGAPSYVEIGEGTIVREHASVHRGTIPESTTIVGRRCFIMATAHVGHNCVVEDEAVIVNSALLAGHVTVGRRAFVSGGVVVHQFARVGELVMIRGGTPVSNDIPPFMLTGPSGVIGPNVVGLRRAGFSSAERNEIQAAYKLLYRSGLLFREAVERVAEMVETAPGRRLVEFLRAPSKRGICGYRGRRGAGATVDETP